MQATLNNPRVSDEAKESAQQRIDDFEQSGQLPQSNNNGEKNFGNVMGGFKATLKSTSPMSVFARCVETDTSEQTLTLATRPRSVLATSSANMTLISE